MEVVTRAGIPDCVVEMQQGAVAAVSSDDIILAGLAAQDPQTEVVGRVLRRRPYGVGMTEGAATWSASSTACWSRAATTAPWRSINTWLGNYLVPLPNPHPRSTATVAQPS